MGKLNTNYKPDTATPIEFVPQLSQFFDTWPTANDPNTGKPWVGAISRTWILFFESLKGALATNPVIGFDINDGSTGTNIGPVLQAARSGQCDQVTVAIKAADASTDLTFDILQNGVSIFATLPTLAAGISPTVDPTGLGIYTIAVTLVENDIFTMNITSGTSDWQFTAVVNLAGQ